MVMAFMVRALMALTYLVGDTRNDNISGWRHFGNICSINISGEGTHGANISGGDNTWQRHFWWGHNINHAASFFLFFPKNLITRDYKNHEKSSTSIKSMSKNEF